jgi:hypothetical protein
MLNRSYHFAVHANGTDIEELGDMEFRGDAAALSFARLVIKELIHKDAGYYTGGTMDVTEDKRAVGTIAFKS